MTDLCSTVNSGFAAYLEKIRTNVHKWVDPLSDDQFWKNPFSYGNDIGHLVLHLTGNLNHYIGAHIAQSGYVRDRHREFTETQRPAKTEILKNFDQAVAMVIATVGKQSSEDWSRDYDVQRTIANDRFGIILNCTAHADHHLGQIINLSRELQHRS
jgi:uncharacterized damage-inducible protein DinB